MTTFKNFFFLTILALVAVVFTANNSQAQTSVQYPYYAFNADDEADYDVATVPSRLEDGRQVIATHKKTRTQIIAVIKSGKIAQIGVQPAGGRFKALSPAASPCNNVICATFQIKKCFTTPWGTCICVCGAWITAAGGAGN